MEDNVDDLNLESEIFHFFDYTSNDFSKLVVLKMLQNPLSTYDIVERQNIIRSFLKNSNFIEIYSYSKLDFHESYDFLDTHDFNRKYRLTDFLFLKKDMKVLRSKTIQFVTIFFRISNLISEKLVLEFFSTSYHKEVEKILLFFSKFKFSKYHELIKNDSLRYSDVVSLLNEVELAKSNNEFEIFYKLFFHFEAYISIARGISKRRFTFPTFTDARINFDKLYHPVLKEPILNDIKIDRNVNLLTGPNMAGKSTFLRSLCLSVYLGHLGFPVFASKAEIPFFETFLVAINLKDSLQDGYSHFMREIIRLKSILKRVHNNEKCFVVFDELFKSTNLDDAYQITIKTLSGLAKLNNSFFFISTHILELGESEVVSSDKIGKYYIDSFVERGEPRFDYKVKEGWSNAKIGLLLFEQYGLNKLLDDLGGE